MTLMEMSVVYQSTAAGIHARILSLQKQAQQETDPESVRMLRRRMADLLPILQEARQLCRLTAHYYD